MFNLLSFLLLPLLGSINSNTFPPVLTDEEEKHYLSLWQNKDLSARNTLIEHNLRLVAHIVKKFEHSGIEKDDLLSIGAFGLIKPLIPLILNKGFVLLHTQQDVLKMKF